MKSSDYWRQREHAHIAAMRGKDAEYDKQLTMFYANTEKSIQKEIDAFYGKYALQKDMTLAEAKKKVSQMDVQAFSEKAKRYVEEKNFSDQANEELKLYNATMKINRLELLKSEIGLECASLGNDLEKYAGDTLTDEAKAEAQRQAGILGTTLDTFDAKYMKEVVTGSYTDATFSDRIWGNNESLKHNLDTLLTQAIIGGKHPDVLARQLQKQFGTSQYEARRLMRTESSRIQGQIAVDSYKEGGIEEYEWVAEPTACEICKPLDGKRWKVNGAETGNKEHPMFPMHPNCRCAVIPVVDEKEYDDWMNYLDKGGTTAELEAKNKARSIDSMYLLSNKNDAKFTREDMLNDLQTSEIGRSTIKAIRDTDVRVIVSEEKGQYGNRGYQQGNLIKLFSGSIDSKKIAAQTLIHEMTHYTYHIGQCQHAEAVCFAMEKMHIMNRAYLTETEWEYVKKLAIDNYPEYNWEQGGYGDYGQFKFVKYEDKSK